MIDSAVKQLKVELDRVVEGPARVAEGTARVAEGSARVIIFPVILGTNC